MKIKGSKNKKGVSRVMSLGYIEIFKPEHPLAKKNGYIREHRMIAYDAGILTNPLMEVHHINEIKTDNRLENLKVMTKAEHASLTWRGKKRKPFSKRRREAISKRMIGNKNWQGNIYENSELLK